MAEIENRREKILICIALSILVLAVYWGVKYNEFIYLDDPVYVTDNRHVQDGLSYRGVAWAFRSSAASNWHPLTWISLMADRQLYGKNPAGYHWTSVILHLMSTLVLFLALRRMTGQLWCSGMVAALFGVHPLHVESVAWVSERKDVLSGLFWMLGLWGYAWYAERPGWFRYGWVVLFFIMGLMSKPMVVTFPFVLLLLDWWPLGRFSFGDGRERFFLAFRENGDESVRRFSRASVSWLILEKTPFLVLSIAASIITFLVQKEAGAMTSLKYITFPDRLMNAVLSYTNYLVKMVWPYDLAAFYPYLKTWSLWEACGAFLFLFGASGVTISCARRLPYLAVGWFWYLGTLVPVIGIIQVGQQAMADRYTYLPLIGVFIMVVWFVSDMIGEWRCRKAILSFLSLFVLAVFAVSTVYQVSYWRDNKTLFEHALRVTRNNHNAYSSIGVGFMREGKLDDAIVSFRAALKIAPDLRYFHRLGVALMHRGDMDEAIVCFRSALKIRPDADFHNNLFLALAMTGQMEEAMVHYREALRGNAGDKVKAYNNMGAVYYRQGKFDEARLSFARALELQPDYADAHNNLGFVLSKQGRHREAISHYEEAIRLDPENPKPYRDYGIALMELGRKEEAMVRFREALRLQPDNGKVLRMDRDIMIGK